LDRWTPGKLLEINLQLFAADDEGRTEKATPKKRQDARKKGQVLQSREITASIGLLAVFLGLKAFSGYIFGEISLFMERIYTEYIPMDELYSYSGLYNLMIDAGLVLLKTVAPVLAIALVAVLVSSYAQVGFLFTTETLKLKLDKINPLKGFKRIFSMQSTIQLTKSAIKVVIVSNLGYTYLIEEQHNILQLMDMDITAIAVYIGSTVVNIAVRMCIALLLLSLVDYLYQWWEFEKSLKMSKQEVKEEYKQLEGNPEIKSRIKQKQRQISMRRMIHDVPKADVVITNPDHYAVAIKYDEKVDEAPVVIAKGQGFIAQRIKEVARENDIQLVENKPLARALYSAVEVGEAIPRELYQAVAEVLAYVYSMKKGGSLSEV